MIGPFPSSPLTQGAFTACSRVSELQAFTQTAEVKVDPDKPLEGARLAVLQVALWRKNTQNQSIPKHCSFFSSISSLWITNASFITILDLLLFFFFFNLHRHGKRYWSQLLASELDFSIKLHLHRGPAKKNSAYVPPLRFQFADFHLILHTGVISMISKPSPEF